MEPISTLYSTNPAMADYIAKRIVNFNHWLVLLLVAVNCAIFVFAENQALVVALSNLISLSIGYLWQERQQVVGFFYGSSLGSKMKEVIKTHSPTKG